MRLASLFGPIMLALAPAASPAASFAQDTLHPSYPPGFDCSSVPAGSQRQACQDSQVGRPSDPIKGQSPTGSAVQSPGTVSPPTVPDQPNGENGSGGSGNGGSSGIGTGQ